MYGIVHAPIEIAGQMGLICQTLKKRGFPVVGYNTFQTQFNFGRGIIDTDIYHLIKLFESTLHKFDLYHFHNSYTFLPDYQDLPILKDNGKKIVMHHRGNDVRLRSLAKRNNPYVNAESSFPDAEIEKNLKLFSKYVSAAIVQDYELYEYVKDYYEKVYVLPRLIDLKTFDHSVSNTENKVPIIVHAPTNREFKGSDVIEKVLLDLKKKYVFQYILVENQTHREALSCYRSADIIIDQILCGMYGNLSVEVMAMGKPVVAYIREDLKNTFPEELPIVSANPDSLRDRLIDLLENAELRRMLGEKGRSFVERYHSADIVIEQLIQIYQVVMGTP